jgi:hypothetical protein
MRLAKGFVHSFDFYGEQVAPINMGGKSKYTTCCGGLVGLIVSGLLLWFMQTRGDKLINKKDANMYQVE